MNKKRVLFVSEAHYTASGFGTYAYEVLSRLAKTKKYELAEFACYGNYSRINHLPWKFYAGAPEPHDPPEMQQQFNANPINAFGFWRFDRVVCDFKPDIVITYRDPWMDAYIDKSGLRKFFHWVWMPTVDSAPQKNEWVDIFNRCDAIFTYSEFGTKTLLEQSPNMNVIGCASPAADYDNFFPLDLGSREKLRKEMGIDPNAILIGTVMRNQKRKLFPELMKAFKEFLDKAPTDIANRSYLYFHTSYPERAGWDITNHAIEYGLTNKILVTYICKACRKYFSHTFSDPIVPCKACGNAAVFPNVGVGIPHNELHKIYNLFDVYVQYAIAEGFGIPAIEAILCGIPTALTNYSAMEDIAANTDSFAIPVIKKYRELETNAERVYPSDSDLADWLAKFLQQPIFVRNQTGLRHLEKAKQRYGYDMTAKIWENYIDNYHPVGLQGQWNTPRITYGFPPQENPEELNNESYVMWLYNAIKDPQRFFSYEGSIKVCALNYGASYHDFGQLNPVSKESMKQEFTHFINMYNAAEELRTHPNADQFRPPYIIEAHRRYQP